MTNNETDSIPFEGDQPLKSADGDKLGFRDLAERIATSLVDQTLNDGMVIGIEGAWGSGKTSLLSMIREGLKSRERPPSVIDFRPWLIGDRDALIASLFGELSGQLNQIKSSKAKKAFKALQSFRDALSPAGVMLEAVGEDTGSVVVRLVGKAIKAAGGDSPPPQLSALKEELAKSLKDIDHRFIITIDDVDRLEPREVIEVLRLIRSVVHLPNVIYLLCYDRGILIESVEKGIRVESGEAYLEKIVQLPLMVPNPESLQLRQWFSEELSQIASAKNESEARRLESVIAYEGGRQLRTPRSVNRVLDAIRFFWPPLRDLEADLADLVWLQLIKDGNPKLYRWIENYCATITVVLIGEARVDDAEKTQQLNALSDAVSESYFDSINYRHCFAEKLLGVRANRSRSIEKSDIGFGIFVDTNQKEYDEFIRDKRLSSPDHYRLYFAFNEPSYALTSDEFKSMWDVAETGAEKTGKTLLCFHREFKTNLFTKADILLERIKGGAYETLSAKQCENFLVAFSQVMDEAYKFHSLNYPWRNPLWREATGLMPLLLSRLKPKCRESTLSKMFRDGEAISWLTSIFLQETSAHDQHSEIERPFTNAELDRVREILLKRYRSMSINDVLGCIKPSEILIARMQGGDSIETRNFIIDHKQSDEGFVKIIEGLLTNVYSSAEGEFKILEKSTIDHFMDYGQVVSRVRELKDHADLSQRACRLEEAIKLGAERDR